MHKNPIKPRTQPTVVKNIPSLPHNIEVFGTIKITSQLLSVSTQINFYKDTYASMYSFDAGNITFTVSISQYDRTGSVSSDGGYRSSTSKRRGEGEGRWTLGYWT